MKYFDANLMQFFEAEINISEESNTTETNTSETTMTKSCISNYDCYPLICDNGECKNCEQDSQCEFGTCINEICDFNCYDAMNFFSGDGTKADPYTVGCIEQFEKIKNNLDSHFIQIKDLDASKYSSDSNFFPLSSDGNEFTGSYNGNNREIKNIVINDSFSSEKSIFGSIIGATLSNITLVNPYMYVDGFSSLLALRNTFSNISNVKIKNATLISLSDKISTVCLENQGSINNVSISAYIEGGADVAGITNFNWGSINKTSFTGHINNLGIQSAGFATFLEMGGSITNSRVYNTKITSNDDYVAGLVNYVNNGEIRNSYAKANITGVSYAGGITNSIFGFTGGSVHNTYFFGNISAESNVNYIASFSTDSLSDSYANLDAISNLNPTPYSNVISRDEMKNISTYTNWDFENIWFMGENSTPELK